MGKVESRNNQFADRHSTKIWLEKPLPDNPYIADELFCHGFNLTELMQKRNFIDVFFLLFNGQLPTRSQAKLLEQLMIALINPGPRHASTRAGLNAAIGKTDSVHILPISLAVLGGAHLGASEVEASMRFVKKQFRKPPEEVASHVLETTQAPDQGDWHPAPGFGSRFSSIDRFPQRLAEQLLSLDAAGKHLRWGNEFAATLNAQQMGWLIPGVAATALLDAGFNAKTGAGLFQLFSAPGLLAHGLEMTNKPITAMPFITDEDYIIEEPNSNGY